MSNSIQYILSGLLKNLFTIYVLIVHYLPFLLISSWRKNVSDRYRGNVSGNVILFRLHTIFNATAYACVLSDTFTLQDDLFEKRSVFH